MSQLCQIPNILIPRENKFQISYADILQTAAHGKTKQQKRSNKHPNL
jgi:hypothetical protein